MALLLAMSATAFSPMAIAPSRAAAPSPSVRMAVMPPLPVLAAACTVPTCLGFWKTEYGVSYAYGAATAIVGGLALRAAPNPIVAAHAACVLIYGIRLNMFLLWREISVQRFREFREKIEARTVAAGGRLKRTPFVLSCSFLYFCMCAPLLVTSQLGATAPVALAPLVGVAWFGLLLAAVGDGWKSFVKAREGPDTLVITGPFRLFRHPNYTGEQILWTANALCAFVGAAAVGMRAKAPLLVASVVGWAGICFVLARATSSLEKKQSERYAAFVSWRKRSFGGWRLAG